MFLASRTNYVVRGRGRRRRVMRYLYGCSPSGVGMWWDCGPYDPRQFDRAIMLMKRLEDEGRTDHWIYEAARVLAWDTMIKEVRRV